VSHWIHPQAEAELAEAAVYYATHASQAIAQAFLAEYERVRDLVVENQGRGSRGEDGLRLYHFDRFPCTVIHDEDPQSGPQVLAVSHQRREPGYWNDRSR
jgi:plasmid stabilization system protein ParE